MSATAATMMVVKVNLAGSLLLSILLNRCVVLLRSRDVPVLQVRRKSSERLSDRVRIGRRSRWCGRSRGPGLRSPEVLRQRRIILLGLRQVPGLQILPELLKLTLNLLKFSLPTLHALRGAQLGTQRCARDA